MVYPVEEARRLEERWVRAGRVVAVRPDLSAVVDVGYVRRVPLWPATCRDWQRLGRWQATGVPLFDIHEGAAGKLDAAGDGALIPDEAPAAAARRSIPAVRKH
ncbi:MAG: hypothetical protein F4Y40_10065 [Acidimicrobiia bacterium]|nr:hypothetical protein [Acidimicrobiia bacterium]